MNKAKIKQILFIILIILFIPFAIYTLIKAQFLGFLIGAAIVYIIIQLSKKYLVN